jgi:predicted ester cyclase
MQAREPTNAKRRNNLMSALDMANKLLQAIEAKDTTAAAKLLTDDFIFSGPVPKPISGREWLAMQQSLGKAFPDWKFNVADLREEGGKVRGTIQITGTHKGELDLSSVGMPKVPATGKAIKLPRGEITLTVSDGKFTSLSSPAPDGGGVMGILSQLGVKVPAAQ